MNTADCLRGAVAAWPELRPDLRLQGIAGRVLDAARDLSNDPASVGEGDLYSLVWHWLRHDSLNSGVKSRLTIPAISPWPSSSKWRDRGFAVADRGNRLTISARPWAWELKGPLPAIDLALAAPGAVHTGVQILSTKRRAYQGAPADPFFADVFPPVGDGELSYRTSAQREAIRAVLTAPPGASIVVSLPTGGGKSAVALVPSLLGSPGDLSLFIMPTTALALDQERAVLAYRPLRGKLRGPFTYHSGLDSEQKKGFQDRIRSGNQRILFTSPEAALQSLRGALFNAAEAGRLRYVVVDEAHMISEWGDEFRPEFQHLAGLRWDLLRLANQAPVGERFRTLLLSATLTRTSLETLRALFGGEHFRAVASVSIRPEPFFFLGDLSSREERLERLPDTITRLPKPLVIYVTKKSDAADINEQLRQAGFRRIGMVTGDTAANERRRVITDWRRTKSRTRIDVVVANSAFGLGIDMDEIRTVVHACIPETFDRFYQEVGRGGRDGHACLSVFLPVESDNRTAESLSKPTLIGKAKGSDRWTHMLRNSDTLGDSRYRVDIRDLPSRLLVSEQSRAWNLRTLALMSRAGLIRLRAEEPPRLAPEATEEERRAAHTQHQNTVIVELTDAGSWFSQVWDRRFEKARMDTYAYFHQSFTRVRNLVQGGCPFKHARETYAMLSAPLGGGRSLTITPHGSCGGCARHPFRADINALNIPPSPARPSDLRPAPKLARLFYNKSTLLVTYPSAASLTQLRTVFRRLVRMLLQNGVVEFVEDFDLARDPRVRQLHRHTVGGFAFFSRELASPTNMSVPTAVFVSHAIRPRDSLFFRPVDSPPCVVIAPQGLVAPWKPETPLKSAWSPHWPIADFEAALS